MKILAIETSCDETAAAVVEDGWRVLANEIASSAELHVATGGIVPEVAAREHVGAILPVIDAALAKAEITIEKIDALAVTAGPGLASSLLAGVVTANALAEFTQKKLVPVNHIFGHVRANWLEREPTDFEFPIVCLTASGGHNELLLIENEKSLPRLIGETRDDAAGEAFDKAARLLGLPYPGGPSIQKNATTATEILPRAWLLPKDISRNFDSAEVGERLRDGRLELSSFDFSFSGLKSELRRRVADKKLSAAEVGSLAAAFQDSVVDVSATKLFLAARKFGAKEIHLAGGVSANLTLREKISEFADGEIKIRWPEKMEFCTDNAAMIASAAAWQLANSTDSFDRPVNLNPNLSLA